jgi:selenocysteine lyase/cysteine desulfurase
VAAQARAVRELFRARETELLQPLLDFMDNHPRIRLIGRRNAAERAPTVAFTVEGFPCAELGTRLSGRKLGLGVGDFYAYRLLRALRAGEGGQALRASFVHYTSADDINRLIEALDQLL